MAARGGIEFLFEERGQLAVAYLEKILRDDGRRRIHQNVDAAEFFHRLRGHRRDRSIIGEVGGNAENTVGIKLAELLGRGGVGGGILADEDDASAFGQQLFGARLADAAAAAGNNRNPVFQPEIQIVLLESKA